MIHRIETARPDVWFEVGDGDNGHVVAEITPLIGDPSIAVPSGYLVRFQDGWTCELTDVVAVWSKPEKEADEITADDPDEGVEFMPRVRVP